MNVKNLSAGSQSTEILHVCDINLREKKKPNNSKHGEYKFIVQKDFSLVQRGPFS